jgi:PBP1b-binding outer membrane lipoprotein LpoB
MKHTIILVITLGVLFFSSCANEPEGSSDKKGKDSTATAAPAAAPVAAAVYICPMDTDVVSSTPGKCPKCGMDLVEKK